MDKSLYPDGVVVDSAQLAHTETSKQFHIQRRTVDTSRGGRVSGLEVTINGTVTSRFDISSGHGYTGRGDYIEDVDGGESFALADYTSGTSNYFVLIYRETAGTPKQYETSGNTTRNTVSARDSELRVISQAEYDGLADTHSVDFAENMSSADLTQNAQDRMIVLGVVKGKGFTLTTPNGYVADDYTNGNITKTALFSAILTAALPTVPTITGANIKSIALANGEGTGSLKLYGHSQGSATATGWTLSWAAPGGTEGTQVAFESSTTPQVITCATNGDSTKTISVEVFTSLLPQDASTYTDAVTTDLLYEDTAPTFSVRDELHRHKTGSYVPTPIDPHGMGFGDFGQQVANLGKLLFLGNDVLSTEAVALLARITAAVRTATGERTLMANFTGGSSGDSRIYVTPAGNIEFTRNARWDGTTWTRDVSNSAFKWVYDTGFTEYAKTSTGTPWADTAWDNSVLAVKGSVSLGTDLLSTENNLLIPRIKAPRPAGGSGYKRQLLSQSRLANDTGIPVSIYAATETMSGYGPALEIIINGLWNGYTNWVASDNAQAMVMLVVDAYGVSVYSTFDNTASDSVGSWSNLLKLNALDEDHTMKGSFTVSDSVRAGSALEGGASASTPRLILGDALDTAAQARYLLEETVCAAGAGWRRYIYKSGDDIFSEEALNCAWNSSTSRWVADQTLASAQVIRKGSTGQIQFVKDSPTAAQTWTDSVALTTGWHRRFGAYGNIVAPSNTDLNGLVYADMNVAAKMTLRIDYPFALVAEQSLAVSGNAVNFNLAGYALSTRHATGPTVDDLLYIPFTHQVVNSPVLVITNGTTGLTDAGADGDNVFAYFWHGQVTPNGVYIWFSRIGTQDEGYGEEVVEYNPTNNFTLDAGVALRASIVVFGQNSDPL